MKTFCLLICLSFVWMFFFPSRSIDRLGLLSESSKLTCFAKKRRHGSWGGGGGESISAAVRHTCGVESELEKGKIGRGLRVQTQNMKKKPSSTHDFESRRVRVRAPKLCRRNARCTHQRMQWSDTRYRSCSAVLPRHPLGCLKAFLLG